MAVAPGSIAFVAYSFDDANEGFAFAPLVSLAPGETIRFIDGQWTGSAFVEESGVQWTNTTGATIPAGTVIQVDFNTFVTATGTGLSGWTKATTNIGSVTSPVGDARWQIQDNDSLYAASGTSAAAPGTLVAGIVWGGHTATGVPTGASMFDPTGASTGPDPAKDVGSINTNTADKVHATAASARTDLTNVANWTLEGAVNNGTGAEWPFAGPNADPQSPLYGKPLLKIETTVVGTANGENLEGRATDNADLIMGLNGADQLKGLKGNDTLWGDDPDGTGDGDDKISGDEGDDVIYAGGGKDDVKGGTGKDTIWGGDGDDTIQSDDDDDLIIGGNGNDNVQGGNHTTGDIFSYAGYTGDLTITINTSSMVINAGTAGTDTLQGIEGLIGGEGNDKLTGVSGNDTLGGGGGNDSLKGEGGNDNLSGGEGNDTLVGGAGSDVLTGNGGLDTADYTANTASTAAVTLTYNANLSGGAGFSGADGLGGTDTVRDVETILGGAGADKIIASADAATGAGHDYRFEGNGGADELRGGAGNDTLVGGAGNDALWGNGGTDTADYTASTGAVTLTYATALAGGGAGFSGTDGVLVNGAAGTDTLRDMEAILGGGGADKFDASADTATGAGHEYRLEGNGGADALTGGAGNDTLVGGAGADVLTGGAGNDTADYSGSTNAVNLAWAAALSDNKGAGFAGADGVASGGGTDTVRGVETILGGGADDRIDASLSTAPGSAYRLDGNGGADALRGGAGNDTLVGGAGNDALYGNGGTDTADYTASAGAVTLTYTAALAGGGAGFSGADGLGGTDTVRDVEAILGGAGADRIDASASTLAGAAGGYRFEGGSGKDTLIGGAGDDTLAGGAGDDSLEGGKGNDVFVLGGAGSDVIKAGDGVDRIVLSGAKAGYSVTYGQDSAGAYTLITDTNAANGDDGTAKVYNAESLQFTDATDPVCFMPGTLVATPAGPRAVETLRAGDLVLTADGRAAPVRWLGRQTVSTRFADPLRVLPVRITAGALGEGLPRRDLLVSPDHALLVDGVLAHAGALVNGATIRREADVPEVFTYWHVELHDHSLILAEGVPAETFIDNVDRLAFDNWDEHEAAGSEAPIAEMALPRAKSHRQLPQATRRRLAERTALLLGAGAAAA